MAAHPLIVILIAQSKQDPNMDSVRNNKTGHMLSMLTGTLTVLAQSLDLLMGHASDFTKKYVATRSRER